MKLKVGNKIRHVEYGDGIVLDGWLGDNHSENYAIMFPSGGPLGWADKSTNDPKTLTVLA